MEFKINMNFSIKTKIKCPHCKETFEKPKNEDAPLRCPHCGSAINFSKESLDAALKEADAKVGDVLGSMGVQLPQKYADLAKAKAFTKPLNIVGVVATVWAIFFPVPYVFAMLVCALVPFISILVMASFKETIRFETKKGKSEEPSLTFALAGPPLALAWRTLYDFHILAFNNVWMSVITVGIIFSALIFFFAADGKKKPAYLLVTLIFGLLYGYGMLIEVNCLLDKSRPATYTARVLNKRTAYSAESYAYYINVTPWGPKTGEHEISIKKDGYERIKINDEIKILLKEGRLSVPWFIIRLN